MACLFLHTVVHMHTDASFPTTEGPDTVGRKVHVGTLRSHTHMQTCFPPTSIISAADQ